MTYINTCEAPDLGDLFLPVAQNYWLNLVFSQAGPRNRMASSYVTNFILGVDKALREYDAARQLIVEYIRSTNRTELLIEALGRLETCVHCLRRNLRFVDRMAVHPESPEIDRTVRHHLKYYKTQIRHIRDAIEHMDECIYGGELVEGDLHMLAITRNGQELGIETYRIQLARVADLLRQLRALSSRLAAFREEPTA